MIKELPSSPFSSRQGLSNSILRLIERKDCTNACLTYSCMVLTLFIIALTWYYFKYLPRTVT